MSRDDSVDGCLYLTLILGLLTVIGWVANIVQLAHMAHASMTVLVVLKIIGIFAFPLGAVLGLFGLF